MAHRTRTWELDGLQLTDHVLDVPWDHDTGEGPALEVFARVVAAADGRDRPYLLFLQGGPGQESPRPTGTPSNPAWLERALKDYRVVLLDQRGTGRSSPYGGRVGAPAEEARYLSRFRADAIVRDAETLREALGVARWSVLGQSFGGFCAVHYLSAAAGSLREVFITGGLPPVGRPVDEVYSATYRRVEVLTGRYLAQFPGDRERLEKALDACARGEIRLPDGSVVSPARLRTIGNQLGMAGGAAAIHYLLERPPASPAFAADLAELLPFDGRNPLYAVIHEACYADGGVTGWSAERVRPEGAVLTGEHVYPWVLEEDAGLAPYREVAALLAAHEWPRLYDPAALAAADVPVAAAVYADDPFVDRAFSEETAALLPDARTWVTDRYLHNGLRVAGDAVLGKLFEMARA